MFVHSSPDVHLVSLFLLRSSLLDGRLSVCAH